MQVEGAFSSPSLSNLWIVASSDAAEREIKLSNKRENNQNAINASSGWEPKTNGHEIAQDKMLIIFLAELGWNERIET